MHTPRSGMDVDALRRHQSVRGACVLGGLLIVAYLLDKRSGGGPSEVPTKSKAPAPVPTPTPQEDQDLQRGRTWLRAGRKFGANVADDLGDGLSDIVDLKRSWLSSGRQLGARVAGDLGDGLFDIADLKRGWAKAGRDLSANVADNLGDRLNDIVDLQRGWLKAARGFGTRVADDLGDRLFDIAKVLAPDAPEDWMEDGFSTLISQARQRASMAKEGAANLVQGHPGRLCVGAGVAFWWATVGRQAVGLATMAPWAVSAMSLYVAFHSMHMFGSYGNAEGHAPPVVTAPAPRPDLIVKLSASQAILALEIGMAIGAASIIFAVWLCRQKRGSSSTRSA